MPDTPKDPAAETGDRMPTPVKVAAILLGVLAVLLLINAILTFTGRAAILDRIAEAARDRDETIDRQAVSTQLTFTVARDAFIGLVATAAVVLLARRRGVGRWLGIGSAGVLLILALLAVIGLRGLPIYSLLIIVITAAIIVMLIRKPTVDWLRPEPAA